MGAIPSRHTPIAAGLARDAGNRDDTETRLLALRVAGSDADNLDDTGPPPTRKPQDRPDPIEAGALLSALSDRSSELLLIVDGERRVRWVNGGCKRMLGYSEAALVGNDLFPFVHPDDVPALADTLASLLGNPGGEASASFRLRAADGGWRQMAAFATNELSDPAVRGLVVSLQDVTESLRVTAALRATQDSYHALVEQTRVGIYSADLDGRILTANRALQVLLGYSLAELQELTIFELISSEQGAIVHSIAQAMRSGVTSDDATELKLACKDGRLVTVEAAWWLVNVDSLPRHYEGVIRDTTEREMLEEQLREQALHDTLTGLPNRTLFHDRLARALARRGRAGGNLAVLMLDVDDFKLVNDTLGHDTGDDLLKELASRLSARLRKGETVVRLGGDEFALIADEIDGERGAVSLAKRTLSAFAEPFTLDGQPQQLHGSVGIALAQGPAPDPSDLLRDADTAMYRAKTTGKGGYALFDATLRAQLLRRVGIANDLAAAVRDKTLELRYQPIVDLTTGEILAVEALVRWRHPRWGWIKPEEFIPLAEESTLIVPLGRLVLEKAATQAARWRTELPDLLPNGVGINVSAEELEQPDYASSVAATLAEHGLTNADMAIELTERVLIDEHNPTVRANLEALTRNGMRLILDDFGTGYSALASLKKFPLAAVKIDRFFVGVIEAPDDEAPVIRAVVGLGKALGLTITAEGIETQTQLDYVRTVGCARGQGSVFGAPQPAETTSALLARGPLRSALGLFEAAQHPSGVSNLLGVQAVASDRPRGLGLVILGDGETS